MEDLRSLSATYSDFSSFSNPLKNEERTEKVTRAGLLPLQPTWPCETRILSQQGSAIFTFLKIPFSRSRGSFPTLGVFSKGPLVARERKRILQKAFSGLVDD